MNPSGRPHAFQRRVSFAPTNRAAAVHEVERPTASNKSEKLTELTDDAPRPSRRHDVAAQAESELVGVVGQVAAEHGMPSTTQVPGHRDTRSRRRDHRHRPVWRPDRRPPPPLKGGLARDAELVSDARDRPGLLDPGNQQASTMQVQSGVTVHKSLQGLVGCCGSSTLPRRLSSLVDHRRVNNVRGHHSYPGR
jgi:hypothetical protein